MIKFEVQILGSNSAVPAYGRHTSAQLLKHHEQYYLLDCGEGTQMQLAQYKQKSSRIAAIFLSHLHGDHCFGLPGLLGSYSLNGREKPLRLFGPRGIKAFVEDACKHSYTHIKYPLHIFEFEEEGEQLIFETEQLEVYAFPLKHRVPCFGYLFAEKESRRRLKKEQIHTKNLSIEEIRTLKAGQDVQRPGGEVLRSEELCYPGRKARRYAYCTDTLLDLERARSLAPLDLLYHEATFMQDMHEQALQTGHSTTMEAAAFARQAEAKHLLIGHFSSRYGDLSPLLEEARILFYSTSLAIEGKTFYV